MWSKWYLLALIVIVPVIGLYFWSFLAGRPTNLGVQGGRLAPCPASPNCVSTQADDAVHQIDPIPFTGAAADALVKLKQAITTLPRARIVTDSNDYLHVECTSLFFRFVDDVEFWIDEQRHLIHFRSASRVGHSDLGVNRARMEALRKSLSGH